MRELIQPFINFFNDFLDSLKFIMATRFRIFMLIFFLIIMVIFAVEAPDSQNTIAAPDSQNNVCQRHESSGKS